MQDKKEKEKKEKKTKEKIKAQDLTPKKDAKGGGGGGTKLPSGLGPLPT